MRYRERIHLVCIGALLVACGGSGPTVEPPALPNAITDPDLSRLLRERTAGVRSEPGSAEAWGQLALAYDAHDFPERALEAYARAADQDPKRFDWPYLHATVLAATDQVAALDWLDRAAAVREDYGPLFARRGRGRLAVGDLEGASADFQRAVEIDGTLVAAHIGLAKIALADERVEEALAHASRAVDLGPQSDEAYGVLAEAHRLLGDEAASAEALAKVVAGSRMEPIPDPVRAQVGRHGVTTNWIRVRANEALARGDAQAALELWENARASKSGDVEVLIGHSRALRSTGQGGEARATLELARETLRGRGDEANRQQSAAVALGLGLDSLSRGDAASAEAELDEALGFDPELVEARGYRGIVALMSGDRGRGLELLRSATAELPPEHALQINLAMALVEAEQWNGAREVLERCHEAGAATGQTQFLLARSLGGLGEFRLAAESFAQAAKLEPSNESAFTNRARALARAGDHRQAADAYREACERFPRSARAKQRRAWFLATTPDASVADGTVALALSTELLEGRPKDAELLSLAAAAAAAAGDFEAAEARETEALERLRTAPPGLNKSVGELRAAMRSRREAYRAGRRWVER